MALLTIFFLKKNISMFDWQRKKFDMVFFTLAGKAWINKQVKHHPSYLLSKWWKTSLNKNTNIYSLGWSPSQLMPAILVFSTGISEVILGLFIAHPQHVTQKRINPWIAWGPTNPTLYSSRKTTEVLRCFHTGCLSLVWFFWGESRKSYLPKNSCVQGSWRRQSKNASLDHKLRHFWIENC